MNSDVMVVNRMIDLKNASGLMEVSIAIHLAYGFIDSIGNFYSNYLQEKINKLKLFSETYEPFDSKSLTGLIKGVEQTKSYADFQNSKVTSASRKISIIFVTYPISLLFLVRAVSSLKCNTSRGVRCCHGNTTFVYATAA